MKLVHVIPISRGITKERLSYFSKEDPTPGSIVSVPIRNRLSTAIVESTEDISAVKTQLRQSSFTIKKIEKIKMTPLFLPEFINAVTRTAQYSAGTVGAVLSSLTSKVILDNPKKIKGSCSFLRKDIQESGKASTYEKLVFQTDRAERFVAYKSLIRESFARGQSVFVCMPTFHDVEKLAAQSEKGIEKYTFTFHSALTKKQIQDRWNTVVEEKHPVVIIATGSFLSIPRPDVSTIIIDRENDSAYKSKMRPYVDIRIFADFLARELGARVIFADSFLRIETLYDHYESDSSVEFSPLRFRPLSNAKNQIVDMRNYKPTQKGRYESISRELANLVEDTRRNSEHMFIFSSRRGLSPITVCSDCGETVTSSFSDAPMVLHKTSKGNIFMCHQNGEIRSAAECCKKCGSWKLTALGSGVQLIEEQLNEKFPDAVILRIDSDTVLTHKKAQEISEKWYSIPGSILLGTKMALPYLIKSVENIAVASIDSMLSIPDFKIESLVFSTILSLREMAEKKFLLQTRNPEQRVLLDAVSGNLLEFYREEIKIRKKLGYPPFSLFIKLTVSGKQNIVIKEMEKLESMFENYDLRIFSAFTPAPYGKQTSHALIKLKKENWPDSNLLKKLKSLPPQILVHVNPESIL